VNVRRKTLAVLVAPLFACSEPTVSDRGVRVTLDIDRAILHPGDSAHVTVTATNHGSRRVTINANGCPAVFSVRDPAGQASTPPPSLCAAHLVLRELAPGESHVFRYSWAGTVLRNGTPSGVALPAGVYQLRGHVGGQYLRAQSPPVEIFVAGTDPDT
jgi:hypothetical protein